MAARAAFPPGDAREDWAILRALSDVLGQQAALRLARGSCAPRCSPRTRISRASTRSRPATPPPSPTLAARGGTPDKAPFRSPVARLLPDQPDRARLRDHGRVLGAGARPARADGGGVDAMAEFFDQLSLAADHHGGAVGAAAGRPAGRDRLRAARRPQDLGGGADAARAERGRALGPAAVLRRSAQVRAEGADRSRRRQQGRVPARAAGHLRARARRLGGDPGRRRLGDRRHQCRHPLHLRDLLARWSTASSWRAGRRTRNIRSSPRCARPRRWCPTRSRSASSSSRCCSASAR